MCKKKKKQMVAGSTFKINICLYEKKKVFLLLLEHSKVIFRIQLMKSVGVFFPLSSYLEMECKYKCIV